MNLKQHIGVQVRSARIKMGLTQEQVAERLGKAVETISNIERGRGFTGLETLEPPATALRVPLRYFFEGAEEGRSLSKARAELEGHLRHEIARLSDRDVRLVLDLVRVVAEHNSRRPNPGH